MNIIRKTLALVALPYIVCILIVKGLRPEFKAHADRVVVISAAVSMFVQAVLATITVLVVSA